MLRVCADIFLFEKENTKMADEYNSLVIAKLATKTAIMDFSDNLICAKPRFARRLLAKGGKRDKENPQNEDNPNATIKVNMTDYSKETHNAVSYNLEPCVFEQMLDICRKNTGTDYITGDMLNMIAFQTQMTAEMAGKIESPEEIAILKCNIGHFTDFRYESQKVNRYAVTEDGYAKCAEIRITRSQFINAGGREEVRKKPYYWHFEISNYEAKFRDENGLTAAMPETARNRKSASLDCTDSDVYEACWRVTRFVDVFMQAFCVPNYRAVRTSEESEWKKKAAEKVA